MNFKSNHKNMHYSHVNNQSCKGQEEIKIIRMMKSKTN
jgi:hypothetical protein